MVYCQHLGMSPMYRSLNGFSPFCVGPRYFLRPIAPKGSMFVHSQNLFLDLPTISTQEVSHTLSQVLHHVPGSSSGVATPNSSGGNEAFTPQCQRDPLINVLWPPKEYVRLCSPESGISHAA